MIHSAPKVLHEKKRRALLLPESPVSVANPIGLNEQRRCRDVPMLLCHASFIPLFARIQGVELLNAVHDEPPRPD